MAGCRIAIVATLTIAGVLASAANAEAATATPPDSGPPAAQSDKQSRCKMQHCSAEARANRDRVEGVLTAYVPGNGRLKAPREVRECGGCYWISKSAMDVSQEDNVSAGKLEAECTTDTQWRAVYFVPRAGAAEQWRGRYCIPAGSQIASEAELARQARATFQAMLPRPRPSFQPRRRVLINIPTIFSAGQPAYVTRTVRPMGVPIRVTARATWIWHFDDGVQQRFSAPGGEWPNYDVTHTYEVPGKRRVRVRTIWRGEYSLDGQAPTPFAGSAEQRSAPIPLTAVESRPQLVAPE